tara:strand:- start:568 stop:1107 length:540 start_codon:yes stop_codon:yes gene_type:complete
MSYYALDPDESKKLLAWWHWLDDNRGDRAVLRRADIAEDVLLTPAFASFLQFMPAAWGEGNRLFDSALVAGLLARVKTLESNPKISFAQALASPNQGGSKAVMSELRFQQLQKSRDPDEFFRRMTRAVALLGGNVNLLSLADGVLHWSREHRYSVDREPTKRLAVRWARDYYTAFKDKA